MRWNCPHCGSSLAVSDEKVGIGWSFSRCYKCGGFALVRRSDVNLIKVDRAPAGEHVLLPEANENPTALLSQAATNHLQRYTGAKGASATQAAAQANHGAVHIAPAHVSAAAEALAAARTAQSEAKPAIRTAVRRIKQPQDSAPTLAQNPVPAKIAATSAVVTQPSSNGFGLPEPLPDEPATGIVHRLIPFAIGMTGMLAIGSGIYLYVQGQALWEKARTQATETAASQTEPTSETPPAGSEIVQAPSITPQAAPLTGTPGTATAGSANIGKSTTVAMAATTPPEASRNEVTDQVHANAMAPARNNVEPEAEKSGNTGNAKMSVEVLMDSAHIHSGPGMEYPVIGTATHHRKYAVEEWRDRWFKINLENPAAATPTEAKGTPQPNGAQKRTAWIRNDLVRLAP